jgi:hypothetical protein
MKNNKTTNIDEFKVLKSEIRAKDQAMRLLIGKQLANQVRDHGIYENIHDAEFKVFSQFGDDGILQYLIGQTRPEQNTFVEFGVSNYVEANTRFLLKNNNWSGLIIDGDPAKIEFVRHEPDFWRYDLQAVARFIDRDNINGIMEEAGFRGEIGLLSIDIDGNDYWVWEAIHQVEPVLITAEYNSVFGAEHAITIPYDISFNRRKAHYSNLFWGASLKALCMLAEKKGYAFVGCNSAGNNAHFVRKDKVGQIPVKSAEQGYVESKFRESLDPSGNMTYLRGPQRIEAIKDMQIFDLEKQELRRLGDLFRI